MKSKGEDVEAIVTNWSGGTGWSRESLKPSFFLEGDALENKDETMSQLHKVEQRDRLE